VRSVGLPGNAGHLGICFGKLLTMDSPTARAPWSANWKSVLWHEFTHVITLQKTNNRMPRWLSEGISVYEETRQDPSWGMRMSEDYAALVTEDTVGQVAELETYFTRPRSPGHLMFGYFIAGEFVAFYVEEYGFAALTDSLEEIAEGKGTVGALASAANADQQALDDAFGTYLDTRFAPYKNLPEPIAPQDVHTKDPLDVTVIAEPAMARLKADAPFVATMKEAQEAMKEGRWLDAEAALNKAHALFPEYTGQDGPLYGLALVQMNTENIEARKETLEKILQLDSADYPTLDKLMELYLEEENWEKVEALCARAWQLNPFDVPTQQTLLNAQIQLGYNEKILRTLGRLARLDPARAVDYRLQSAQTRLLLGDLARAKEEIVEVLEEMPHYWEAQKLLLAIVEEERGT
jgi:tetratricopeptide (TPR) repeat protein